MKSPAIKPLWINAAVFTVCSSLFFLVSHTAYQNYTNKTGNILADGSYLGGDFLAFKIGGEIYSKNPSKLYDLEYQREYRETVYSDSIGPIKGELPFVYPPPVAALFSLLAELSLETAFYITSALALSAMFFSTLILKAKVRWFCISLGFIPFYLNTVWGGQLSWLGIFIFALVSQLALSNKKLLVGLVIGLGFYKPPLFLFASLYFLVRFRTQFFKGAVISGVSMLLLSVILMGFENLIEYFSVASSYSYGQDLSPDLSLPVNQGAGVFAFISSVLENSKLSYFALVSLYLFFLLPAWKKKRTINAGELAFVLTCSVALSIQCIKYDLALILIPLILTRNLHILAFGTLFFEFLFRQVNIAGNDYNLSSILLIGLSFHLMRIYAVPRHRCSSI